MKKTERYLLVVFIRENEELPHRVAAESSKSIVNSKILVLDLIKNNR